jgi:hypothetical protein
VKHFVSPPEQTGWTLDPDHLAKAISAKWPEAEISIPRGSANAHALEWEWRAGPGCLTGSLDKTGQVVALDGRIEDAAAFARWFGTLVPETQRLLFYDEGYSADMEITPDTRDEELVAPFFAHR